MIRESYNSSPFNKASATASSNALLELSLVFAQSSGTYIARLDITTTGSISAMVPYVLQIQSDFCLINYCISLKFRHIIEVIKCKSPKQKVCSFCLRAPKARETTTTKLFFAGCLSELIYKSSWKHKNYKELAWLLKAFSNPKCELLNSPFRILIHTKIFQKDEVGK